MMGKISRAMLAVYSGIAAFLIILFSLFTYFYAIKVIGGENYCVHVYYSSAYLPFVSHFLRCRINCLSILSLIQKTKYGKIEEKLRALSSGNYESKLLLLPIPSASDDLYIKDIDKEITKIKEKMIEVSSELQIVTTVPICRWTNQRRNFRIRKTSISP